MDYPEICYVPMRISGNHLGCVPSYVRLRQFYKPINFTQMYAIRAELDKTRSYFESEICNYSSELETKRKRTDLWQLPVVISYLQKFNKLELFRPWLFRLIKQLEDFCQIHTIDMNLNFPESPQILVEKHY